MTDMQIKKGHPKGLMTLFFSEMWERFCYYGMRVLLTLYLVKSLMNGDAEAALIYGAYTGLVYAAPILGGKMADKYLGYRNAVLLGAILMAMREEYVRSGNWLFRWRSYFPLLVLILLPFGYKDFEYCCSKDCFHYLDHVYIVLNFL